MSNDLISRSALINLWKDLQRNNGNLARISTFIMSIEKMPTAYDLDKVAEQLKNKCTYRRESEINEFYKTASTYIRPDLSTPITVGEVIEIVKKGGIE